MSRDLTFSQQRAQVRHTSGYTDMFHIDTGVRQGCVLSPLLFSLYINDIFNQPLWHGISGPNGASIRCLLYADDLVLAASSLEQLKLALHHVEKWCIKWQMHFNAGKCKFFRVGSDSWGHALAKNHGIRHPSFVGCRALEHHPHYPRPQIWLNDLEYVTEYKYLGIIIDQGLTFASHITKLENTWNINLQLIKKALLNPDVPLQAKRQLICDKLIAPILWSSPIWSHIPDFPPIFEKKLKQALRTALSAPLSTPLLPLYAECGIPPLEFWFAKASLLLFHRMQNSPNLISQRTINSAQQYPGIHPLFVHRLWDSTELVRPAHYVPSLSRKQLKTAIRDIINATLTDRLKQRADAPTTEYQHHAYYWKLRAYRNIHTSLDWFRIPKCLSQNLIRTSGYRSSHKFFLSSRLVLGSSQQPTIKPHTDIFSTQPHGSLAAPPASPLLPVISVTPSLLAHPTPNSEPNFILNQLWSRSGPFPTRTSPSYLTTFSPPASTMNTFLLRTLLADFLPDTTSAHKSL